jgi:flagellin
MAAFINTNVASLNAQRNLSTSQSSLATSLQRLSSGLRINSAKDDAAGLAISERFSSQIRGVNQAVRNANDGISLGQTAEGAMGELGNNIQRIRELAVQSSNATNTTSDRESIQKEVSQLKAEIDRVANQTEFNGTKLLDGSFSGKAFQVGANAGQTITVNNIADARVDSLAKRDFVKDHTTAAVKIGDGLAAGFKINNIGIDVVDTTAAKTDAEAAVSMQNSINAKADQTGVYAEITSNNELKLVSTKAGQSIEVTAGMTVNAAAVLAGKLKDIGVAGDKEISGLDVTSFKSSQRSINLAQDALSTINSARADLGAIQNRFQSTIANLSSTSENMSAARGRIQDADFASETASMTRSQILQQAGTAMLAQANSLPNGVLALLRG